MPVDRRVDVHRVLYKEARNIPLGEPRDRTRDASVDGHAACRYSGNTECPQGDSHIVFYCFRFVNAGEKEETEYLDRQTDNG